MFLGAFAIVFGEALIFNSLALLWYFLVLVAVQMVCTDPVAHASTISRVLYRPVQLLLL